MSWKRIIAIAGLIACVGTALGQGTVMYQNNGPAFRAQIYGPGSGDPTLALTGNTTAGLPAGTQVYSGARLAGSNFFAQFYGADGSNRPESLLEPATTINTFRTGLAAGILGVAVATFNSIPADSLNPATLQLRVWDNSSGLYPNWAQAEPAWQEGLIAAGKSPLFNIPCAGGTSVPPPTPTGLISFNIYYAPRPPIILAQPQSQAVGAGQPADFTVTADGTRPFSYQWRLNGTPVAGGTSSRLAIASVGPEHTGIYSVAVTNALGGTISSNAILEIAGPPFVLAHPQSQTVIEGQSATFSVLAGGAEPLTYQWRRENEALPGATTSALTLTNVRMDMAGAYSVIVSNAGGTATSFPATLTVLPCDPPVITGHPQDQVAWVGQSGAQFQVTAAGSPPLCYQWALNGAPVPGETRSTLVIASAGQSQTGSYTVQVTNSCGIAVSLPASLSLVDPFFSFLQTNWIVWPGGTVTLFLGARGSEPLSYQWFKNGNAIPGATGMDWSIIDAEASDAGMYSLRIFNPYGSTNSPPVPLFVMGTDGGAAVRLDNNTAEFRTRVYGPEPGAPLEALIGNSASDLPPGTQIFTGPPLAGEHYIAQLFSANGANQPDSTLAAVLPTSVFHDGDAAGTLTAATVMMTNVPMDAAEATFQLRAWDNRSGLYPTWDQAEPAWQAGLIAAGKSPLFSVTNLGGIYHAPASLQGLRSFNIHFQEAPPSITLQPRNLKVPIGAAATFCVQAAGPPPLSYQWRLNGVAIPGATASQYTFAPADYSNMGFYTVRVTNNFGSVTSVWARLSVLVPPAILSEPLDQTVLEGEGVGFSVAADGSWPLHYQWRFEGTNVPGATDAKLNLPNVNPTQAGLYTVVVTNEVGVACSRNARLAVVPTPSSAMQAVLLATPIGLGQVTVSPPAGVYQAGTTVQVTASAAPGQEFLGWSGDASGQRNPLEIFLDRSKHVSANFTRRPQLVACGGADGWSGAGFALRVSGETGATYQIEMSTNLADWSVIGRITNEAEQTLFVDADGLSGPRRFYRAVLVSP